MEYTVEQEAAVKRIKQCRDYYEILSISRNATDSEIKKAYKKLALFLHPDKNKYPGACEAFKSIGNAVAVLTDPKKRKQYDLNESKENMFNYQRKKKNKRTSKLPNFQLHEAISFRLICSTKILLPQTKDINLKNPNGYTPLLLACEQNDNADFFDVLLTRKDIDITITNKKGLTALHILAISGNFYGLVKVLKAFPQVDINKTDDEGDTPLIKACKMCHFNIIEYLLTKGADVKRANKNRSTALHCAANNGHKECVEFLIKSGAEVDAKDQYNRTPFMIARKLGFTETCEVLFKSGTGIEFVTISLSSIVMSDD